MLSDSPANTPFYIYAARYGRWQVVWASVFVRPLYRPSPAYANNVFTVRTQLPPSINSQTDI